MPLFNAYLMVDWSAASRPKKGPDSIWYCLGLKEKCSLKIREIQNPPTRHFAISRIRAILYSLKNEGRRVLVGFDFPYSYPSGFSKNLKLLSTHRKPWQSIWEELSTQVVDKPDNSNNRFLVASLFNQRISGSAAPFWGCPQSKATEYLQPRKPIKTELAEFRLTDLRVRGAQSPWKLFTVGSVGSQILLGIPALKLLKYDPFLEDVSKVWPFENFCDFKRLTVGINPQIVHAEIYPSMYKSRMHVKRGIKDKIQVETTVRIFSELDDSGELVDLFQLPDDLTEDDRMKVITEEGWILGAR